MSSTTSAILYALTVSASPASTVPDDAAGKPHHGKGRFHNPWEYVGPGSSHRNAELTCLVRGSNLGL